MRRLFLFLLALWVSCHITAQETADSGSEALLPDTSLRSSSFNPGSARDYLDQALSNSELWRPDSDSLSKALQRLLDQSSEPYDSVINFLQTRDFSSIPIRKGEPEIVESIDVKWINDSTFVLDPQRWNSNLYLKKEVRYEYPKESPVDSFVQVLSDSLSEGSMGEAIIVTVIDTAAIRELDIKLYSIAKGSLTPPLSEHSSGRVARLSGDSAQVHYFVPRNTWVADESSPFYILNNKQQLDSLQAAINTLLDFNSQRDSTLLLIDDMFGHQTPYWLTMGRDETFRFWVKNFNNDSLSLWVGNPGRKQISLLMEDDVNFNRMVKVDVDFPPSFLLEPERVLKEMLLLEPEPIYWDYEMTNLLGLSQTYLSNWSKGGESTLSTTIDMIGKATYNNMDAKTQWINVARWKFGTVWTKEKGNRVHNDLFEVDSKYNLNAWGKIGMSSSFYFKTQLAKGYHYPNDSVTVSKFLNPGTITVGIGAEYKPWEKTTINIAPLSYKTTFVFDTANIDQTRHGIAADKQAKRELGLQVVILNQVKPTKDLTMINKVRLFSNYLYKPQNIDVDWEMILEQRISWFFSVRLNLHLIYDDDVRFPVYDENGEIIKLPDGSTREAAKPQFREFLGLTLSFNI